MKAVCKDNSHTWRNCLTVGKEYDVLKHYKDKYNVEVIELTKDDGECGVYRAERFDLLN